MRISADRSLGPDAASELVALYETYDWWADRREPNVRRALAATDETIGLRDDETGDLVAAARVLTDYTFYAMVYDVIVHEDYRSNGLGEKLLAAVVTHPPLSDVNPALLAREGLVPFYESCGFEDQGGIDHPDGDPEELRYLAYRRGE